jgi:hypothetical protein
VTYLGRSHPPCYIIGIELHWLPDDMVHVTGFGGEDAGVMKLDAVSQDDTVLCHG